jgi:hypothetical protein
LTERTPDRNDLGLELVVDERIERIQIETRWGGYQERLDRHIGQRRHVGHVAVGVVKPIGNLVIATAYLELVADGAAGERETAKAVDIDREIRSMWGARHIVVRCR